MFCSPIRYAEFARGVIYIIVVFVFCCPIRYAEFARAVMDRSLAKKSPPVRYYGCFRDDLQEHKDILATLKATAYQHWDSSSAAPPKQRPVPAAASEEPVQLTLLGWNNGRAIWPGNILEKFATGTPQHKILLSLKEEFDRLCPNQERSDTRGAVTVPRASGSPDFSIEDGKMPIDVNRLVDLAPVSDAEAKAKRQGLCCSTVLSHVKYDMCLVCFSLSPSFACQAGLFCGSIRSTRHRCE